MNKKGRVAEYKPRENGKRAKNGIRKRISTSLKYFIGSPETGETPVRVIKCRSEKAW
jgi:hypothetical protein